MLELLREESVRKEIKEKIEIDPIVTSLLTYCYYAGFKIAKHESACELAGLVTHFIYDLQEWYRLRLNRTGKDLSGIRILKEVVHSTLVDLQREYDGPQPRTLSQIDKLTERFIAKCAHDCQHH